MDLRSVSYFRERDQGLDHVHHGARDRGRGEVGQGHVGVNGLVEDEGRGQIMRCFSSRTKTWMGRRKIIRVRVAGQRRGISGTWGGAIYSSHYKQDMVACRIWWIYRKNYLTPSESSWRQTPNRLSYGFFTWWGMVFLYPKIRGIPVYVDYCLLPCRECDRGGTRVFGQWSRHW